MKALWSVNHNTVLRGIPICAVLALVSCTDTSAPTSGISSHASVAPPPRPGWKVTFALTPF